MALSLVTTAGFRRSGSVVTVAPVPTNDLTGHHTETAGIGGAERPRPCQIGQVSIEFIVTQHEPRVTLQPIRSIPI